MPIEVVWDNDEKTIIRYVFGNHWTVQEYFDAYPVAGRMMKGSEAHVIGIIVDDSAEIIPPKGSMTAFKQTVRSGRLPIVFVGANLAGKTMMQMLQRAYKSKRQLFFVDTCDEARAVLRDLAAQQASLPDNPDQHDSTEN
jgi:hypothetical protein